jgi:hypothetical protein
MSKEPAGPVMQTKPEANIKKQSAERSEKANCSFNIFRMPKVDI